MRIDRHVASWAAAVIALAVCATACATSWPMYHGNAARTGDDRFDRRLLPIKHAWSTQLDGAVYGQPLVWSRRVLAVTENDTVYALDAHDGHVLWSRHLGSPMRNVVAQVGCGNIDPLGITSTPVIDTTTHTIFVVGAIQDANKVIHHQLFGLDVATGAVRVSANADPGGVQNPLLIQQRTALALSKGRVFIGYGGYAGDCGAYHGWLVSRTEAGTAKLTFDATPHTGQGAIWAPGGPAVDAGGSVYIATGNPNPIVSTGDYGESLLKFDPTLHLLHHFSASNATDDQDLGSVSPALLGSNLVFQIGKQHVGYLLNASDLSKLQSMHVCSGEAFGGTAFDGKHLYVPCLEHIQEVNINATARSMSLGWTGPTTSSAGPPILAGGALWSIDIADAKLYALDPSTGKTLTTMTLAAVPHFASPSAALGLLLIGTNTGVTALDGPSGPPPPA
jgi:polyvinyl alcohol dehydrogenase (cytochrome)